MLPTAQLRRGLKESVQRAVDVEAAADRQSERLSDYTADKEDQ